jgi:ankyrin repeat protein
MDITNRKTLAIVALVSFYSCLTSCCCLPSSFKHSSILSAAETGDLAKIKELLASGKKIEYLQQMTRYRQTPLHIAACNGQVAIAEALLAAIPDEKERLKYIKQRRSDGLSALQLAAFNRHENVVQLMLRSVPRMDIFDAAKTGNIARVKELVSSVPHQKKLEYLIQKNKKGMTPLHLAAENGHLEVIRILTDAVQDTETLVNVRDGEGYYPIHLAAIYGDGKKLPKDMVDRYGEIIRLLVENGACVDSRDSERQTPLHNAALRGNCKILQVLAALGANVDLKDKDEHGQTAADLAWAYQRCSYNKTVLKDTLKFLIALSRINPAQLRVEWHSRLNKAGIADREVEELFATYRPVETYESIKQSPLDKGFTQKELEELFETYESHNQAPQAAQ